MHSRSGKRRLKEALAKLAQVQEPRSASGEAGGRGGLALIHEGGPWRTTSTSRCSRRAWTPGTSGATGTPIFVLTSARQPQRRGPELGGPQWGGFDRDGP